MQDMNKVPEIQNQRAIQQICTYQHVLDYTFIILTLITFTFQNNALYSYVYADSSNPLQQMHKITVK